MVGLYVHLPFCRKKCPYCHFFVIKEDENHKDLLLAALKKEWERAPQQEITTLYLGGGTPTLFGEERLADLLSHLNPPPGIEISIEANPEDVTYEKMRALRKMGINRLSIGLQSLVDEELKFLGRTHSAFEAKEAVHISHRAGFENITIDLMYELPDQNLSSWRKTLAQLESLPFTHLSLYNLTFEEGAAFYRNRKSLEKRCPPSDEAKEMLEYATEYLRSLGLERYEISAFAKPGYEAKHNSGYWRGIPFLGLGPSAFSYYEGSRTQNFAHFRKYLDAVEKGESPVDFSETLPYPDNLKELLAIELRLIKGVDLDEFQMRHGLLPQELLVALTKLKAEGFLEMRQDAVLTGQGRLFYDTVASEII